MYRLGHEVGHTCNLQDACEDFPGIPLAVEGEIRKEWMPKDWGGGYYPPGMGQAELLQHLLMYGFVVPGEPMGDIPAGRIYGLGYEGDMDDPNNWHKGLLKVGLEDINRQPRHR